MNIGLYLKDFLKLHKIFDIIIKKFIFIFKIFVVYLLVSFLSSNVYNIQVIFITRLRVVHSDRDKNRLFKILIDID